MKTVQLNVLPKTICCLILSVILIINLTVRGYSAFSTKSVPERIYDNAISSLITETRTHLNSNDNDVSYPKYMIHTSTLKAYTSLIKLGKTLSIRKAYLNSAKLNSNSSSNPSLVSDKLLNVYDQDFRNLLKSVMLKLIHELNQSNIIDGNVSISIRDDIFAKFLPKISDYEIHNDQDNLLPYSKNAISLEEVIPEMCFAYGGILEIYYSKIYQYLIHSDPTSYVEFSQAITDHLSLSSTLINILKIDMSDSNLALLNDDGVKIMNEFIGKYEEINGDKLNSGQIEDSAIIVEDNSNTSSLLNLFETFNKCFNSTNGWYNQIVKSLSRNASVSNEIIINDETIHSAISEGYSDKVIIDSSTGYLSKFYLTSFANSATYNPFVTKIGDINSYEWIDANYQEYDNAYQKFGLYSKPLVTNRSKTGIDDYLTSPNSVSNLTVVCTLRQFIDRCKTGEQLALYVDNNNSSDLSNSNQIINYELVFGSALEIKNKSGYLATSDYLGYKVQQNIMIVNNILADFPENNANIQGDLDAPLFVDTFGNIITKSGYVIIPASINSIYYHKQMLPISTGIWCYYPKMYKYEDNTATSNYQKGKYAIYAGFDQDGMPTSSLTSSDIKDYITKPVLNGIKLRDLQHPVMSFANTFTYGNSESNLNTVSLFDETDFIEIKTGFGSRLNSTLFSNTSKSYLSSSWRVLVLPDISVALSNGNMARLCDSLNNDMVKQIIQQMTLGYIELPTSNILIKDKLKNIADYVCKSGTLDVENMLSSYETLNSQEILLERGKNLTACVASLGEALHSILYSGNSFLSLLYVPTLEDIPVINNIMIYRNLIARFILIIAILLIVFNYYPRKKATLSQTLIKSLMASIVIYSLFYICPLCIDKLLNKPLEYLFNNQLVSCSLQEQEIMDRGSSGKCFKTFINNEDNGKFSLNNVSSNIVFEELSQQQIEVLYSQILSNNDLHLTEKLTSSLGEIRLSDSNIKLQGSRIYMSISDLFASSEINQIPVSLTIGNTTLESYRLTHNKYMSDYTSYYLPYSMIIDNLIYNVNSFSDFNLTSPNYIEYVNGRKCKGFFYEYFHSYMFTRTEQVLAPEYQSLLTNDGMVQLRLSILRNQLSPNYDFLGLFKILGMYGDEVKEPYATLANTHYLYSSTSNFKNITNSRWYNCDLLRHIRNKTNDELNEIEQPVVYYINGFKIGNSKCPIIPKSIINADNQEATSNPLDSYVPLESILSILDGTIEGLEDLSLNQSNVKIDDNIVPQSLNEIYQDYEDCSICLVTLNDYQAVLPVFHTLEHELTELDVKPLFALRTRKDCFYTDENGDKVNLYCKKEIKNAVIIYNNTAYIQLSTFCDIFNGWCSFFPTLNANSIPMYLNEYDSTYTEVGSSEELFHYTEYDGKVNAFIPNAIANADVYSLFCKIEAINNEVRNFLVDSDQMLSNVSDEHLIKTLALMASLEFDRQFQTYSYPMLPTSIDTRTLNWDTFMKSIFISLNEQLSNRADSLMYYMAIVTDIWGLLALIVMELMLVIYSLLKAGLITMITLILLMLILIRYCITSSSEYDNRMIKGFLICFIRVSITHYAYCLMLIIIKAIINMDTISNTGTINNANSLNYIIGLLTGLMGLSVMIHILYNTLSIIFNDILLLNLPIRFKANDFDKDRNILDTFKENHLPVKFPRLLDQKSHRETAYSNMAPKGILKNISNSTNRYRTLYSKFNLLNNTKNNLNKNSSSNDLLPKTSVNDWLKSLNLDTNISTSVFSISNEYMRQEVQTYLIKRGYIINIDYCISANGNLIPLNKTLQSDIRNEFKGKVQDSQYYVLDNVPSSLKDTLMKGISNIDSINTSNSILTIVPTTLR